MSLNESPPATKPSPHGESQPTDNMASAPMPHLALDPTQALSPIRALPRRAASPHTQPHSHSHEVPPRLPPANTTRRHPAQPDSPPQDAASLFFVGNATMVLQWEGVRLMTDPNFLHAGDHVHLGPGVTGTRLTDPAVELGELPRIDVVLLSHYHEDHFDKEVEESLRRSLPIITTPHAKAHLAHKPGNDEAFTSVFALDPFQSMMIDIQPGSQGLKATSHSLDTARIPAMKVTGMPGKHVPPGVLDALNELVKAVPPTNGWMLELGYASPGNDASFHPGYRIYISGDTLLVDELKEIPIRYAEQNIDLMLIHLGGTTIPSPNVPLLMVTMDATQGLGLVRLINPDITIPIHYDDYDVFLSPLADFKKKVEEAGLSDKVVYSERKDIYEFEVNGGK